MNYQDRLVSICIPTYNGDKYLASALESIEQQTYKNIEVIVSDDNSQDNTISIVKDFKNRVEFPVHIYHHNPTGIGSNWNNSIKNAKGEFIKFLFQDDVLLPNCIELMLRVILSDNEIELVASKRILLLEDVRDEITAKWVLEYRDLQKDLGLKGKEVYLLNKDLFKDPNFLKSPLNKIGEPTAVLFKKSIVNKYGFFREDLEQILDFEFYYRILKKGKIAIINKELVGFRLHALQATNVNRKKSIGDYQEYEKILYNNFFWNLEFITQKRLFLKFNKFIRTIRIIRNAIK